MKTLKLSIALAISFAAILAVSGYVGYTDENTDGVNNFKSHIYLADCNDIMDDLCADRTSKSDALLAYAHIVGTANEDGGQDDPKDCNDPSDDLCDNI